MATCIIIKTSKGRLGNQIHPYAAIYAYCLERGHRLVNNSFGRFDGFFENLRVLDEKPTRRKVAWRLQRYWQKSGLLGPTRECPPDGRIVLLPPSTDDFPEQSKGTVFFLGWRFRNPEGIRKHLPEVREYFKPAARFQPEIDSFCAALPPGRLIVGVHIRQTDFKTFHGGLYYFTTEEYRARMEQIRDRYAHRRPFFCIFSDEPRSPEEFPGLDCAVSNAHFIVDLYRMARCHFILGTSSSFSAWAATYGDSKVLIMHRPEQPEHTFDHTLPIARTHDEIDVHLKARGLV